MLDQYEKDPTGVPWYIWACVIAVTCGGVGGIWDISWHKSIGRDNFWTPAHILIYLCGVIAGLTCGYVILAATFSGRAASVSVWGFRGPLGAFLCAWGGIAMITSAPFDDWWHNVRPRRESAQPAARGAGVRPHRHPVRNAAIHFV